MATVKNRTSRSIGQRTVALVTKVKKHWFVTVAVAVGGALTFAATQWGNITKIFPSLAPESVDIIKAGELLSRPELGNRVLGAANLAKAARRNAHDANLSLKVLTSFLNEKARVNDSTAGEVRSDVEAVVEALSKTMLLIDENRWTQSFEVELVNVDFRGLRLDGMSLRRAALTRCRFEDASMERIDLSGANIREVRFERARAAFARFSHSHLLASCFEEADLSNGSFSGAELQDVDLNSANLVGLDLRKANLTRVRFQNARMARAQVSGVDLREATGLLKVQLKDIVSDADTRFPEPLFKAPATAVCR